LQLYEILPNNGHTHATKYELKNAHDDVKRINKKSDPFKISFEHD